MTQEMRIKGMIPVLPKMSMALPSLQNSITSRSSSVPRYYQEPSALTARLPQKVEEPNHLMKRERNSYGASTGMNRVKSVEILKPKVSIQTQHLETDQISENPLQLQSSEVVVVDSHTQHYTTGGEIKEESEYEPMQKDTTEELELYDAESDQKIKSSLENETIQQSVVTEQKTLNHEEVVEEEETKSKQDTFAEEVIKTSENSHLRNSSNVVVVNKRNTQSSAEYINESIQAQEQSKAQTNTLGYTNSFEDEEDF